MVTGISEDPGVVLHVNITAHFPVINSILSLTSNSELCNYQLSL